MPFIAKCCGANESFYKERRACGSGQPDFLPFLRPWEEEQREHLYVLPALLDDDADCGSNGMR